MGQAGDYIRDAIKKGTDRDLMLFIKNFIPDIIDGRKTTLIRRTSNFLAKTDTAWNEILEDVKLLGGFYWQVSWG